MEKGSLRGQEPQTYDHQKLTPANNLNKVERRPLDVNEHVVKPTSSMLT